MKPLLVVVLIFLLSCVAFQRASGENTTYVVALLGQEIYNGTVNPDIEYQLVLTRNGSGSISVDITGNDSSITSLTLTGRFVYTLYQNASLNGSEYTRKSFHVHSQDGFFTLQVFCRRLDHNYVEGFLAIPIQTLKGPHQPAGQNTTVYNYVVSSFCDIGGYCQVAVAALQNGTTVSIIPPRNVEEIAICKGKGYFRTKRDTKITMDKYEAFQLESTFDLTGTVIYSFEPIVVFAGSRNVTNGNVVAHTMEQLVPTSHWGSEYIVTNLGTNGYGDILKIVSHWSDTKITMKGFPSFIMKEPFNTAVRRLDKGFSSHIQATHPIQVVQITGLSYATENETSTLSMTVVPSVQNAVIDPVIVSCPDESSAATFFIVQEKTATGKNFNPPGSSVIYAKVIYTKYMIEKTDLTAETPAVGNSNGNPISGVMQCGTASMPISVLFNKNVSGTTPMTPNYTGGVCYEGGKASTKFYSVSGKATRYLLRLHDHPDHVVEMRIRSCGEVVLQFLENAGNLTNSFFMTVTHKQIIIRKNTGALRVVPDNSFHITSTADWDCEFDMVFIWFMQKEDHFCFGFGKYNRSLCEEVSDTYFVINSQFRKVKMMGLASDAAFSWDLIHPDGCDIYESDWRCADRWTNCSAFGSQICNYANFSNFSHNLCARFCGKCFPDSYGRKFIARIPSGQTSCRILVSPLNKQTNVAVVSSNLNIVNWLPVLKLNAVHGMRHANDERYYDCSTSSTTLLDDFTIYSDDDVSVIILLLTEGITSYRVYPVDTFDTEFMTLLSDNKEQQRCDFISEHDTVNFVAYFSIQIKNTNIKDSLKTPLGSKMVSHLWSHGNAEMSGAVIIFDKPSTVFCGKTTHNFIEMLPVSTWSTEYVIPAYDEVAINRWFEAKLYIVSNSDNTIVNITGGFDAVYAIYNRGDLLIQDIDAGATYRVTASQKIEVGMYLYDRNTTSKSSFHILPPSHNLHDTVVTSVPNKVLTGEFDVTDIKTYFVNATLGKTVEPMAADDTSNFYRSVRLNSAVFGMSVVKYGNEDWFVIQGNVKNKVQHMDKNVCIISNQNGIDNEDNDCDGLWNEDVCYNKYGVYREDKDLDGGFGEDCSEILSGPVVVSNPVQPMCLVIDKPADQCWTACTCKCSWVQKYEAQKNMSKEEFVEAQQEDIKKIQNDMQLNKEKLRTTVAQKTSAEDERRSAAGIGYVGIALFALVFGIIFIMDISSLLRDARILLANLREGFERLSECFKRRDG